MGARANRAKPAKTQIREGNKCGLIINQSKNILKSLLNEPLNFIMKRLFLILNTDAKLHLDCAYNKKTWQS